MNFGTLCIVGRVGTWVLLVVAGLGWIGVNITVAQEKQDRLPEFPVAGLDQPPKDQIPTLPETKVEAKPSPATENLPAPPAPTPFPGASLSQGGVFGSAPATGYLGSTATSGSKIDLPLIDIPSTVIVVPRQTIDDQQAYDVNDIIRDFGGVATSDGPNFRNSFIIRGFENTATDNRWNGFLDPFTPYRDLANIERVEVLKGPASGLYGAGQPSGIINYITKRPEPDEMTAVNFMSGTFGLFRTTIDTTGTLDANGRFLYRFVGMIEDTGSFRDFNYDHKSMIAPSFAWIIDDGLVLNIDAVYQHDRRSLDSGLISNSLLGVSNGQVASLPISRYLNNPGDFNLSDDYKISAVLTRQFNENWTGRVGMFATWDINPFHGTVPFDTTPFNPIPGYSNFPTPATIARQTDNVSENDQQYYSVMADLNGKFDTGFIKHNLLVGTEIGWLNSTFAAQTSDPIAFNFSTFEFAPNPASALNVLSPVYGGQGPLVGNVTTDLEQQRYGFYAQDLMELNEHWKLMAGVRGDIVHQTSSLNIIEPIGGGFVNNGTGLGVIENAENDQTFYYMSPRVGIMYQPIPDKLSFYGSYGLSFDPPTSGLFAEPIVPETGQTVEGGIRMMLIENKLLVQGSGFYIVKEHVVTADASNFLLSTQIGKERSQGAEFSMIGNILENWSVIANYSYVDGRVLVGNDPNTGLSIAGNPIRNVAHNNFSLWTRYNILQDYCRTLGVGLGVVYVGDRAGDLQDSFTLPGYTRWDAGVFYNQGRLRASAYFENVFNHQYYVGSYNDTFITPGNPFTVRGSVGIVF